MEINDKLLDKLSQLSALCLNESEKAEIKEYLKDTLSHFEKIKEIDTQNVKPLTSPLDPPFIARKDQKADSYEPAELIRQAPQKLGLLIKTPPMV